ncbi:MAG: hypothetical protein K0R26_568 [Bacteroidota bacterium]|jgi:1-acyl-sn-glycerol-3-phosphate acyltransferase|nr:hypothetical protein [Bacteroidota bacterium]
MGFVIAVYFKRAKVKNAEYLRVKGPVIIAMNHPNAFMDPIAFTTLVYPPRVRYLARGDAFKKGVVSALLESLGIIPIYRIQDGGKEGLKKNDATYEKVKELLKRNKKIIIFAEGLCVQERRLRPLKKGVPRMILGCMEDAELNNLLVVPVGINYSHPSQFRSTLFCNIGEPIKMANYLNAYKEAPAKTMNQFLADLTPRMKELIVQIDDQQLEKVIANIEEIYHYDYLKKEGLKKTNPEHDFIFSTDVVRIITQAAKITPDKVKALQSHSEDYLAHLKKLKLKDWLINPTKQGSINYTNFYFRIMLLIVTSPLYIRGIIASYLPYRLSYEITKKKVRVIEFKASFNMGIGAVLFLIYYLLQFVIAYLLLRNAWWAFMVILSSVITSVFCLYISPFRKKTFGIYRLLRLKATNEVLVQKLTTQRSEILSSFRELAISNKI